MTLGGLLRVLPEPGEDFGAVGVGFDARPDLRHLARGVDDEGRADDAFVLLAVVLFEAPGPVGFGDGAVGVDEEREREFVLVDELVVRGFAIAADTEDGRSRCLDGSVVVAEVAGFPRATGGVVLWVEVEDDPLTAEGGEGDLRARSDPCS